MADAATPGRVSNPLLNRSAGATSAPSKFSLTSPSPSRPVAGGSVRTSLGGRGADHQRAVTFAIDQQQKGIQGMSSLSSSEDVGIRRRKGGTVDGKENNVNLSNIERINKATKPPPKASLLNRIPLDMLEEKEEKRPGRKEASSSVVPSFPGHGVTDPYATWVTVYGFVNNAQYRSLLARFESYGTVLSRHGGDGSGSGGTNWICLRYETALQAEKALCQHGTFLDGGAGRSGEVSIVGVMRVDATLARKLGLSGPMGGDSSVGSFGARNLCGGGNNDMVLEEKDILIGEAPSGRMMDSLAHRREIGVCGKIISFVFGW